ncbi:MauE/DoxX family redox-associated membrane protein [Flavobacterium saccharophilum]|uniref:Methylamine utilisation protein MauE n=1 Tax=Flavobacterium saccharophilum TaxID=29534 RepID=A0A1M7FMP6_9FLAO|nr:MauE/DoxX family redox-associated membrane protein [Flavobacterium saccharophilum]SHM04979.1 Methylamine utilisation protein MauE [Flavobacterium saccharophilum]
MILIANTKLRLYITEVVTLLYILLFVYAAVSKLLDFENFQVQLGQSPLLSAFASWVSWLVPIVELLIVLMLIIPTSRKKGLIASLSLMTMFTAYIFIILHYSSFVPCSCGGILEKMSWNVHLIFNIVFMILTTVAIIFSNSPDGHDNSSSLLKSVKWISATVVLSAGTVIILFLSSEDIMHHDNPFIRRYSQHPVVFISAKDLKFNSYYLAGSYNNKVFLGNFTDPLHILSVDAGIQNSKKNTIVFDPQKIPFRSVKILVRGRYFYLTDGSVPAIFRGRISNWKVTKELKGIPYFTLVSPVDSSTIAFRSNNAKNAANVLGTFNGESDPKIIYHRDLLQAQGGGIFDTDGTILFSEELKKTIYLYYYRNEFMVIDRRGKLVYRSHTIDTITHAKIKVASLNNGKQFAMSSPPFSVNAHAAVCKNLLFVHSEVKGKFENDKLWEKSFIIDVYDLNRKSYLMSFPIFHTESNKLNSFMVTPSHLYALIGNNLVVYEIRPVLKKEMKLN